jgi:predicted lipoprotein
MIKRKITVLLCAVFIAMLFAKCKKKDESAEITPESSFDKTGMLSNIGENIIIPNYNELKTKIDSLKILNDLFIANPSLTSLNALQTQFIKSYFTYQSCSTFEIGPAEDEIIRVNFNTFPCDTLEI